MNNLLSYNLDYQNNIDKYNKWLEDTNSKGTSSSSVLNNKQILQKMAKNIANPIILFDRYEHKKAEDSETFFQTLNIELMSAATLLTSLAVLAQKALPVLNKYADKNKLIKKSSDLLNKYSNAKINIKGKQIPVSKAASLGAFLGSSIFYITGMKKSMNNQLGMIRKASYDASKSIIDNPKIFADLTDEQQKQIDSICRHEEKTNTDYVNKIKDRFDINSSFKSVNEFRQNKKEYEKEKSEYFLQIEKKTKPKLNQEQNREAEIQQNLFEGYLSKVEHNVLEPLRKVETISNITYSSLFTGGFLEYLISDKLVDVMHINNKPVRGILKLGVPILTYMLLNKNISNIENKAILATKYKHLKEFTEDPAAYSSKPQEKQSLPKFIKSIINDMKEYDNFTEKELPKIERELEAKKTLTLSPEQEKQAKLLQENTKMVLNNQREHVYKETVGIKSLSETILGPIDIIMTAVGAKLGSSMAKKCPNKKLSGLLTGLGAVIAFIPAAIIEAKLTRHQKLAEKIAAMHSIEDIKDASKFAESSPIKNNLFQKSNIFKNFPN